MDPILHLGEGILDQCDPCPRHASKPFVELHRDLLPNSRRRRLRGGPAGRPPPGPTTSVWWSFLRTPFRTAGVGAGGGSRRAAPPPADRSQPAPRKRPP